MEYFLFLANTQTQDKSVCELHVCRFLSRTDEEDGEGDEEQEDMGDQVESVHEAAIVQHAAVHAVGISTVVVAAKRQGHATARPLHASLKSICKKTQTSSSRDGNQTQIFGFSPRRQNQ